MKRASDDGVSQRVPHLERRRKNYPWHTNCSDEEREVKRGEDTGCSCIVYHYNQIQGTKEVVNVMRMMRDTEYNYLISRNTTQGTLQK